MKHLHSRSNPSLSHVRPGVLTPITAGLIAAGLVSILPALTRAATLFQHDFQNATAGAVTTLGDLGAPGVGTWSVIGNVMGGIRTDGGTDLAFVTAHDSDGVYADITQMANVGVPFSGTYPETQVADSGAGDVLVANLASGGFFSSPGEKTTISYDWGAFGNSNNGAFKYGFIAGYDGSGNQVFELLFQHGSAGGTRRMFARGADDASTTLTAGNLGAPEGVDIYTVPNGSYNSTGNKPADMVQVFITLENDAVSYAFDGGSGTSPIALNSGATEITELRFSAIWNNSVAAQNKGYWLDNLEVTHVVPEPSTLALGGVGLLALLARRRQSGQ
jgi:hypothetical protein